MAIQWSSDYLVGNSTIDQQHQELFRAFNALIEACRSGRGKAQIEELVDFLEGYVVFHFGAEERLMHESAFPGLAAHQQAHQGFIATVAKMKATLRNDGPTMEMLISTNETVLRWLIEHIRKTDTVFGAHLRGQAPA